MGDDRREDPDDAPARPDATPTIDHRGSRPRPAPSPASAPPAPDVRYVHGAEIARGGMGRVVEATDLVLGRSVAVKEALTGDRELRRRFARETRITALLEHPSIVPVYDAGTSADGAPFYVMRKVAGRPLEDLVVEATTLDARLALLPHLVAAAQAIARAHRRGVLHRDLKPTNILVGDLGETVVIDWGLAKLVGDDDDDDDDAAAPALSLAAGDSLRTRLGVVIGTPGFMPPEQLRGEPLDPRVDVYALGATLYFLLARRPPHVVPDDPTGDATMEAALAGPPRAVTALAPGVPAELATIVDRALAFDPARRYADAAALAEELQRFLTGQLVASHRYTAGQRLRRFARRHRAPLAIAGLATAALAVTGALAVQRVLAERDRAEHERGRANAALADALARNEELVLAQARALLETNPTAAAALVKPLARARWREARAVALAARARGVAWGYPASGQTRSLTLSADGAWALSIGFDEIVRVHALSLDAPSTREVARITRDDSARFAPDSRHVLVLAGAVLRVLPLAGAPAREIALPAEGKLLETVGAHVYVALARGGIVRVPLDGRPPVTLAIEGMIQEVEASADGRWLAARSDARVAVVGGDDVVLAVDIPKTLALALSPEGERLAVMEFRRVTEFAVEPTGLRQLRAFDTPAAAALWVDRGGILVSPGGTLLDFAPGATTPNQRPVSGTLMKIVHGPRDVRVLVPGGGAMSIEGELGARDVPVPTVRASHPVVSRDRRWLLLAGDGVILRYDLEAILPRSLPIARQLFTAYATSSTEVLVQDDEAVRWFDLAEGSVMEMQLSPFPIAPLALGGADAALIGLEMGQGEAVLLRRGAEPIPLERPFAAWFIDAGTLITVDPAGVVQRRRAPFEAAEAVGHLGAPPALAATDQAGVVAITTASHELLRLGAAGIERTRLPTAPDAIAVIAGTVYVASDRSVRAWPPGGGALVEVMSTPRPIFALRALDEGLLLIHTDDDAGYVHDPARPGALASRLPAGSRLLGHHGGRTLLYGTEGPVLVVTDATTGVRWPAASVARQVLDTAPDGTSALVLTPSGLMRWETPLPRSADATAALLDQLTNADASAGAAALSWR